MPAVRLDGAVLALCAAALLLAVVALRLRATLWRERRQHLETARKLDDTWHLEELAAELSRVTTAREAVHAGLTELLHWLHCAAGAVVLATGDTSSLGTDGGSLTIAHAIASGGDV